MTIIRTLKRLIHKVDTTILTLMGENKDHQKKLILPEQFTATELRRSFIRDYVKSQPSLLQVTLLTLYVNLRHLIGSAARLTLRRPKGTN